jgi:hypothetical protein
VELTGQGAVGDLTGSGTPNYVLSNTGVNSFAEFNSDKGNEHLPQTYEQAFDVSTGSPLASFPRAQDGFPFFDAAIIGNLDGSSQQAVVESNDSGWIHAFAPSGGESPGFPKFTGQWPSFSGVLAPAGPGGQQRLAYGTREGSLFVWNVGGTASKDSWPHFKGDIHNDGTLSG